MTRRAKGTATRGVGCGVQLKGRVPDHWSWRDGRAVVTGWHWPDKRPVVEVEEPRSSRGVVSKITVEQGQLL